MINPLENLEPSLKIRLMIARLRNVCYYRAIDNRPRAQYMHVFRSLRRDIRLTLTNLPIELEGTWKDHFIQILRMIPPKIKTEDCSQVANNVSSYIERYMGINWSEL